MKTIEITKETHKIMDSSLSSNKEEYHQIKKKHGRLKSYLINLKNYSGDWIAFTKYVCFIFSRIFSKRNTKKDIEKENRYKMIIGDKKEIKIRILGNEMILPSIDKGLSKDLLLDGIREKEVQNLIKRLENDGNPLVTPNSIVIEIGANIGYYALQWAKIINKGLGTLYAIEPNPNCFKYLKRNLNLNRFKCVQLFNKGISNKKGIKYFKLEDQWNLSRVVKKGDGANIRRLQFDSLDNLFKGLNNVDLIRMDIEGHEYNLLEGAESFLNKNKNLKILMEYHPNKLTILQKKRMVAILKKAGFTIKYYTDIKGEIKHGGDPSFLIRCIHPFHFLFTKENNK